MEITEANNRLYIPEDQGQHTSRNFIYKKSGARPVVLMVKDRWMYKYVSARHHVSPQVPGTSQISPSVYMDEPQMFKPPHELSPEAAYGIQILESANIKKLSP